MIDAINQTFTLFQLNYHNQFFSAFPDQQDQDFTKKLWLESLGKFTSPQILQAAKAAIEQCEYLPNLHRMIQLCQNQGPGGALPSAHDAYVEACHASSPKAAFNWSHPAVYHAAVETGWHTLSSEMERKAFPLFEKSYQAICQRVLSGEQLTVEAPAQLEEQPGKPLSREESRNRAAELKKLLGGN
ncbi:MAG: replication protein P [Porticoccaceae bacterium]|nr:replication protein P [Porticoccaceae bacterium]